MRASIALEPLQVDRVVHFANPTLALFPAGRARFVCAGLHAKLAARVLKHLGHEELPVDSAVMVKRRQNFIDTSNADRVSLTKVTSAKVSHNHLTVPPSCIEMLLSG
jgi:hypothetical protein